jgi:hypothetical protein
MRLVFAGAAGGSSNDREVAVSVLAWDEYPENEVQHDLGPGQQDRDDEERPNCSARPAEPVGDGGAHSGNPAALSRTDKTPIGHGSSSYPSASRGLGAKSCRRAKRIRLVRALPGEVVVVATEVAVDGSLRVDRPA